MVRALRLMVLGVLWMPVFTAAGASVVATVDRNVVGVNESFRLTFEADGDTGEPDFSPLTRDFQVLDQSRSQNLSIVNGKTSRTFVWELLMMAPRAGVFTVPPIAFGADRSQPIEITVSQQTDTVVEDRQIFLDVEVDVEQPYVQQQVVCTVKLFRVVDVSSATLSELKVEGVDAIVERLGEDQDYELLRNGRRWRVVERKYVIFPQQSGHMTIAPFEFRGRISPGRRSFGLDIFGQSIGRPVALRSESVTLPVREPPASFAGPWLPARRLTLEETWPGPDEIRPGDPITRTLTVKAWGLTAAQLPELDAPLSGEVRSYPEQPKLDDTRGERGIVGERIESTAIIPTQPGTVTLPEVRLAWWNIDAQRPELAVIPARVFEVTAAAGAAEEAESIAPQPSRRGEPAAGRVDGEPSRDVLAASPWWPWVSLALALAWLATALAWVRERRRGRASAHSDRPQDGPDRRQALAGLRTAAGSGDPRQSRDALLHWGAALWPDAPPRSLGALAARVDAPLAARVRDLERALYARGHQWDGAGLYQLASKFQPQTGEQRPSPARPGLEPLYKS